MSFELLLLALLVAGLAVGGVVLWATLQQSAPSAATDALSRGDFERVGSLADTGPEARRDDLYAAAVASKHLLQFDRAVPLLERILAEDPDDGEAWLELGLVHAWAGRLAAARNAFSRAEALRSDLAESLSLHRAWLALQSGAVRSALHLFEEIEVPLETKLRTDLGSGEPIFVEWFLHAASLWEAQGKKESASWAHSEAQRSAPSSLLPALARGGSCTERRRAALPEEDSSNR